MNSSIKLPELVPVLGIGISDLFLVHTKLKQHIKNQNTDTLFESNSTEDKLLGVKFSYFEQFMAENGGRKAFENKSTAEINATVLVTICRKGGTSVCQQLHQNSSHFIGKPTWFISHAWSYKFLDVIEAVGLTLRRVEGEEKYRETIVWFDQFTLNHTGSKALDIPYETLHDTFMNSVRQIGNVVMVMLPWDNPFTLTRAWCVFEAYAAVYTKSRFEVGMSEAEHQRFLRDIEADSKGQLFYNMLAKIKSESSIAAVPSDRTLIHHCITEKVPGGFIGLDRAIFQKLEEWIITLLESQIVASENDVVEARWKYALSYILRSSGRLAEAQPHIESALSIRAHSLGRDHIDTLFAINRLALLYHSQGKYELAEPLFHECLETRRRVLGEESSYTLDSLNNLALVYESQGKYDQAEPLYEDCLATCRRLLGNDDADTLNSINNMAVLYHTINKHDKAEHLYMECLVTRRRVFGDEHPDTVQSINNLGYFYDTQGKYEQAEILYIECLATSRRIFGDEHPDTLNSVGNLAGLYTLQGKHSDAESLYCDCLATQRRVLGEDHPETLDSLHSLAKLYKLQGNYQKAEESFVDCLTNRRRVLGNEHPKTQETMLCLGEMYLELGNEVYAAPLLNEYKDLQAS